MQLSEKEIERLIRKYTLVGRVASFTPAHPDGEPAVSGAPAATHAIAERMREGVVLETKGAWLPPSATHKGILWIAGDEYSPAVMTGGLPTIMEGKERVTVTVTREE